MSLLWIAALGLVWPLAAGTLRIADPQGSVLEFAWDGCASEREGPICVVGADDEIVLWVRGSGGASNCDTRTDFTLGGHGYRSIASGADDGGCWSKLKVHDPAGVVELRGVTGEPVWRLPFSASPRRDPDVVQAMSWLDSGDFDLASAVLRPAIGRLRMQPSRALDLADGLNVARKLAFRTGRITEGVDLAQEARHRYRSLGWTSAACDITFALVHHHWFDRGDMAATMEAMREGARCVAAIPRYAAHYRFNRAEMGDGHRDEVNNWLAYRNVDVFPRRLLNHDFEVAILSSQYVLADRMRQLDDVARIEARLDTLWTELGSERSCGLANALANVSWSMLMRHERGEVVGDPRARIEQALAVFAGATPCRSLRSRHNGSINLALAELQHGEPRRAEQLLSPLEGIDLAPEEALWRHVVLARAGLALGNLKQAQIHCKKLEELAQRHADPTFAWYSAIVRGQIFEALGEPEQALGAYRVAEVVRDELALPLALGAGRERADAEWNYGARRIVELELARGGAGVLAAMRDARLARRRGLRVMEALDVLSGPQRRALVDRVVQAREAIDVDARGDGSRTRRQLNRAFIERRTQRMHLRHIFDEAHTNAEPSATRLREPAQGELVLVFYPVEDHWVEFAATTSGATVVDFQPEGLSDEALGRALFAPIATAIAEARTIRLIVTGALLQRDIHGLPHLGRPLFSQAPVAYSLDLTEAPIRSPLARGVVVAADPGGDVARLRFAENERLTVTAAWNRLGVDGVSLAGRTATRTELLRELSRADLFHFIGHHAPRAEAYGSTDPWDHELRLAHGIGLGVEDVLSMPDEHTPRIVILSACQTSFVDPEAASGGVAIGHSFLLRGAELVIATSRPVDDAEAADLVEAFYSHATDAEALARPATLAAAQRAVLGDSLCTDRPDVCAYRAWVP